MKTSLICILIASAAYAQSTGPAPLVPILGKPCVASGAEPEMMAQLPNGNCLPLVKVAPAPPKPPDPPVEPPVDPPKPPDPPAPEIPTDAKPTDGGCCAWNDHEACVDYRLFNRPLGAKNVFYEMSKNSDTGRFDVCGSLLSK